jgi:charged multivesicular body protein 4
MMFNLFGKKPEAPKPVGPNVVSRTTAGNSSGAGSQQGGSVLSQIAAHNKHIESLEKREAHLQKKIDSCVQEAKNKMAKNDKKGAMIQLQRKKMYEKEIETLAGSRMKLEQQQLAMESASVNSATIAALSAGNEAMVQQRKANGIDEDTVADTMDALNEEMDINKEISESLAAGADDVLDDEDLLNDLAELQLDVAAEENVPTAAAKTKPGAQPVTKSVFNLPEAPDAPVVKKTAAESDETDDEEKELRALQASMGL